MHPKKLKSLCYFSYTWLIVVLKLTTGHSVIADKSWNSEFVKQMCLNLVRRHGAVYICGDISLLESHDFHLSLERHGNVGLDHSFCSLGC